MNCVRNMNNIDDGPWCYRGMDEIGRAAASLAWHLRDEPWYHRTSMHSDVEGIYSEKTLAVWAERAPETGELPDLPKEWHGFPVMVQAVDSQHPCPFGSVKAEYGKPFKKKREKGKLP